MYGEIVVTAVPEPVLPTVCECPESLTEIDAAADTADGRTVRLAALLVLEIAAGLAARAR